VVALLVLAGDDSVFTSIATFFSKIGGRDLRRCLCGPCLCGPTGGSIVTTGLKPGEMLDGLGMAETTPGPLIMVLQFVGFMAAYRAPGTLSPVDGGGALAGLLATWVTFHALLPVDILGALPSSSSCAATRRSPAPWSAHHRGGLVGVILNLAIWFCHSRHLPRDAALPAPRAFRSTRRSWRASIHGHWRSPPAAVIAIFRFKGRG